MEDQDKTKEQLLNELACLRLRLAEQEREMDPSRKVGTELPKDGDIQRLILNNSIVGICFVRNRLLVWANPRVAELLNMPFDQLQGSSTRILYSSDQEYEDKGREEYEALRKGEWFDFQVNVLRRGGGSFIARVAGKAINPSLPHDGSVWIFEDITERKKAEELLRESEAKYRLLVDNAYDMIWTLDAHGILTYASPSLKRILGYEISDVIGGSLHDFVHPDDVAICRKAFQNLLKHKKQMAGLICKVRHADDTWHWHTMGATPVFNSDGSCAHVIGISRDITDQKRAEEALNLSEAKLRGVFDATPIGLFILKDRVLLTANKAWYQNIGYVESEIVGASTRILYEDEAEYERVGQALYANSMKKDSSSVQTKIKRKNSVFCDVVLTASPLHVGTIHSGMVVAMEDITERKQTVEALRENRQQLADIVEFLPDATMIIDKDHRVIGWNRAMENMTGIKKEEIIGEANYEYALPFYGYARSILVDLALQPDRETEEQYAVFQRAGDTLHAEAYTSDLLPDDVYFSATASVLRNAKGEITAAIECIRDTTKSQKLAERLSRAEKMEAVGMLAGGVAHDLNNVLGVLVGYSELLTHQLPQNSRSRKYVENILKSSLRAAAIIQDLLTLARRGVTVSEVINLNEIISDCLALPEFERLRADHPGVKIMTKLDGGLLHVKGSAVHLCKSIMNLVSNAMESICGEGKVTIQTENRYLDYPIRGYDEIEEGDYAVLTVSDSGSGITDKDRARIFEPFYTKKVMGRSGTGLGLTVVWNAVKDHRGYIDVISEEAKGSTFTLYFPLTGEQSVIAKGMTFVPDAVNGRGENILVVDRHPAAA